MAPTDAASRIRVRRHAERGRYDRATVDAILDEGLVAHVGFVAEDGTPVVIPTAYARVGDDLLLHGATGNRMLRALAKGAPCCVTVTLLDGLVLARSTFHHSMNYRSVVVFGVATTVEGEADTRAALDAFVEHVAPGRVDGARPPTAAELRSTLVVRLPLDEASAKVREGGPIDDADDLDLPHWAGVLPLSVAVGALVPDERTRAGGRPVPDHVAGWPAGRATAP